jgi:hypothetical protein
MILKQSTNYVRTFMMVQTSDHIGGLTGASPAVRISKAGNTGALAANSPATEVDATNNPGLYKITLTIVDTNTLGELGFHCTAASGDPTDFIDQVQTQIFTDLSFDATGNMNVTSNVKKNTAHPGFMFIMTAGSPGTPTGSLAVTGFRALDRGAFAPLSNPISEMANGWYGVDLTAADTNGNNVALRFIAAGANDTNLGFITQP